MAISDEICIICGIEILRYHDCPHSAVEAFDYCCPNCNVHYDFNFNIVEEFVGQPTPTTPTTPENPKDNTGSEGKDQGQPSENPKENPSQNPSDKDKDKGDSSKTESSQDKSESSTSDKDTQNDTDKSDEKSESSKSDSSTKSEFIPTPPPPTQITSSIKVLQEINSLQSYLATIK